MRRYSLLSLWIPASRHLKTLPSYPSPYFLHQLHRSSLPEVYTSPYSSASRSFTNPFSLFSRALTSSSSPANIVHVGSEEGFNTALKKAKDEKLPSIFYFTAAWCGPCRLISPVVEQMSKELPHVTTYKLDIDQEGLTATLSKLQIFSVPTILFYHNGEKASEIVGADVTKLKETIEGLYK
ncbi:hypothetical protein KFK09_013306 [Dendrobium nobile]|uniref:Thioredoxin domain-containing protein n=1 Tax=Dendrobium nobile TaxID=94219 RepID=A0A8T3B8G1_DENNO|nr:hypothetical protein KFK09_013306 [Dendrobium nobile]